MYWCVHLPAHVFDVCACVRVCVCVHACVCVSQSMHNHSLYFREPHSPRRVAPSCGGAAKHNQQVRVRHATASCMEEEIPHQKGGLLVGSHDSSSLSASLASLDNTHAHKWCQYIHVCTNTHTTHTPHTHHACTHIMHAYTYIYHTNVRMYTCTHTLAIDYCRINLCIVPLPWRHQSDRAPFPVSAPPHTTPWPSSPSGSDRLHWTALGHSKVIQLLTR